VRGLGNLHDVIDAGGVVSPFVEDDDCGFEELAEGLLALFSKLAVLCGSAAGGCGRPLFGEFGGGGDRRAT
jgi:hypothetical protein